MNRQDMALSGLNPATQALSGNDLILLTQNTPNGLQSVSATLAQLLQYLFFGSGEADEAITNLGYLKEVTTGNLLEGNGKTNNPLNIKLSPGAGNLLQSRSDGLYYGIGASSDEAITNLGYLKQVYILNPNSGLIGDGRSSNPMSVNFSYLDTLYVNETDFTNYQNNVNTRFDNVNTQINNINNSISQGVVPNSRNVNTGAGLVGGGNLSADRTISMGVPSSITSGSSNSASGDTHSHELAAGAVTNAKIADGSVTNAKLANGAVDTINITSGAVINAHIGNGSVTTSKLADGAVTTSKLADGAVNVNKIANGAVISAKIADGAVDTIKINNGAVTDAKIVSMSASKITGVIPSENLPPASATINIVDNLVSWATNEALSANQGRILAEQLVNKLSINGGTVTGNLSVGEINLNIAGSADFPDHVIIGNGLDVANTINTIHGIWANKVIIRDGGRDGEGEIGAIEVVDNELSFGFSGSRFNFNKPINIDHGSNITTISHDESGFYSVSRAKFATNNQRFFFDKDVYFGTVNKSTDGYCTLPNGLFMQWGRYDTTVIEDGVNVTFPIAFPNFCLSVIATRMASVAESDDADGGVYYVSSTTIGATFNLQGFYGNSKGSLRGFTWMAIGY